MAGDWIKFELTTPDKPEVVRIAALLRMDQDAATGKLFRIWAWADQNSLTGEDMPITLAFVDRLTSKRGFAAAMQAAGWLTGEDGALTFPNFNRHNGATAKMRAESNRRMQKSREMKPIGCMNVAEKAQRKAQPEVEVEKRREDKEEEAAGCATLSDLPDEAEWLALQKHNYPDRDVDGELVSFQCFCAKKGTAANRRGFEGWLRKSSSALKPSANGRKKTSL